MAGIESNIADPESLCPGCRVSVRIPTREVDRLVEEYLAKHADEKVPAEVYHERMRTCLQCPDLVYGTTCRHCGCLVAVRAMLAGKHCAAMEPKW